MTKSRGILTPKKKWREEELDLLRARYADTTAAELAEQIGCKVHVVHKKAQDLGLQKSDAFRRGPKSGRLLPGSDVGVATRFAKGHTSHNAGRKGLDMGGRSRETRFKKGQKPHNWVPVGSYRVNSEGYLDRKVTNDRRGALNWVAVHRLVWIEANGAIPAGHIIAFKPGRKTTQLSEITVDAIELVTLAEHAIRNSYHTQYPKEIGELIRLKGQITRHIRKREQQHEKQD